jgi:hypothetical protein
MTAQKVTGKSEHEDHVMSQSHFTLSFPPAPA